MPHGPYRDLSCGLTVEEIEEILTACRERVVNIRRTLATTAALSLPVKTSYRRALTTLDAIQDKLIQTLNKNNL